MSRSLLGQSFFIVTALFFAVTSAAHAQQATDPDASSGGVLPVPYIIPRTSTVDQVSTSDKKRLKGEYVKRKAAERDTIMVLANALPVAPSTPTTLAATAAFAPRASAVMRPQQQSHQSSAPAYTAPVQPAAATPLPARTEPAFTEPPSTERAQTEPTQVATQPSSATRTAPAATSPAPVAPPSTVVQAQIDDEIQDTTATVADSTGEYFIIRPVLNGTKLRPSTVNRVVGLAAEYSRRSLDVTYILAVEAAPRDDDATDALLDQADALRRDLIGAGADEQHVIVRDAPPTGPKSSIRILLRGPRVTAPKAGAESSTPTAPVANSL
jgi:hypothetical protein